MWNVSYYGTTHLGSQAARYLASNHVQDQVHVQWQTQVQQRAHSLQQFLGFAYRKE